MELDKNSANFVYREFDAFTAANSVDLKMNCIFIVKESIYHNAYAK